MENQTTQPVEKKNAKKCLNLQLKAIYFCFASNQNWGKGYSIKDAKKNAKVNPQCEFHVLAAVLDNPTEDELKNLFQCISANQIDGSPKYYDSERTEEDTKMINDKHVGWLTIESKIKKS